MYNHLKPRGKMKTLLLALSLLLLATPVFADVVGTGYHDGVCRTRVVDQYGNVVMRRCKWIDYQAIGLRSDVSAPAGLGISLVGRPLRFLELDLGGTSTLHGGGVRAGAMVYLPWYLSPGLSIDGGKNWIGSANQLLRDFGSTYHNSLLSDVSYSFADFYGSLGIRARRWFEMRLYAGYSYIATETHGLQAFLRSETNEPSLTTKEARANIWTPSAKASFTIYFN
jgi:hypothetical protein